MKELGRLLVLNIDMYYTITVGTDLVHAGRLETVTVTEDYIVISNKLGALYRIIDVCSHTIIGEQEVLITHTNGTTSIIEVRS